MGVTGGPQDQGCYAGQGRVRQVGCCSPGHQGGQHSHRFLGTVPGTEADVCGLQGMTWSMCVLPVLKDEMFPFPLGRKGSQY